MRFSTVTRLAILRPPMDLWHWNYSRSGLGFWFESQLALHTKRDNFNWQFISRKACFRNITKHRQTIYHCKAFFATSMNLRSLPLKSSSIGLDQALKPHITSQTRKFSGNFQQLIWIWGESWAHEQLIWCGITTIQRPDLQKIRWEACGVLEATHAHSKATSTAHRRTGLPTRAFL